MKLLIILLIKAYQKISFIPHNISQTVLGTSHNCIYLPTCSEYMVRAIRKYGVLNGISMGVARIGRCRPGKAGGYDPVS